MSSPDFSLAPGRRVLVTGAGGGIGRAVVAALRAGGAEVVALDLARVLNAHPLPGDVAAFACDLTDEADVARAFGEIGKRWSALDGMVALAGFARPRASLTETSHAAWSDVLDGNLNSTVLALKAALPLLRQGREPAIVTMASGLAVKAAPGYGAYGVSKAGVIALTKLLAAEEAPVIRVNVVAPSAVDTPFLRGGTAHGDPSQPLRLDVASYVQSIPLGRLADADDIAGPILFLLSPAARYITGQTLHINGGSLMP